MAQALSYAIVPFWAKPCGRQGAWVQSPRALTPKGTFGWPGTFFNSQSRLCPKGRRVLLLELGPNTNTILELLMTHKILKMISDAEDDGRGGDRVRRVPEDDDAHDLEQGRDGQDDDAQEQCAREGLLRPIMRPSK